MTTVLDQLTKLAFPDREFDRDFRNTYFALRICVGIVGALLPIILVGVGLARGIAWNDMASLSAFYWLPSPGDRPLLRDWFVGSLSATGICLVAYRGYGWLENWLLNSAGAAVTVVALYPMTWRPLYVPAYRIHEIFAFIFFFLIALTVWYCAGNTLDTIPENDKKTRAFWSWLYRVLAFAMFVTPLAALLFAKNDKKILGAEMFGVWVFSAYWFLKTCEVLRVSKVEPAKGPAPKLKWVGGRLQIAASPVAGNR